MARHASGQADWREARESRVTQLPFFLYHQSTSFLRHFAPPIIARASVSALLPAMSSFAGCRMPHGGHHAAHSFASRGPDSRSSPGSQDANPTDESMDEDESNDSYYAHDREQKWTEREDQAFCSSFKRHGRNWSAIAIDIEAVEGMQRSKNSIKAKFYRLRRRGLVQAEVQGSTQAAIQPHARPQHQVALARAPTSRAPRPRSTAKAKSLGSRQRILAGHKWTSEEKAFLQRIGDKHYNNDTIGKERAIYADWMKRYPASALTPHVVTAYYLYMRTKEARAKARLEGAASTPMLAVNGSLATQRTRRRSQSQQGASRTQRQHRQSSEPYEERRVIGKSLSWSRKEIDCLKQAKRTARVGKPDWNSAKLVFEAFRRLIPDTDRTHNAVHQKLLAMYDQATQRGEEDDEEESEDSSSGSDSESGIDRESEEEQEDYATLPMPLSSGLVSQQRSATSRHFCPLPNAKHAVPPHQTHVQHGSFSTTTPTQYSSRPRLDLLFILTDSGIDFENVPPRHGIAVYSPSSFKLLGPAEVETLARALEDFACHEEQQEEEGMPAFAFQVLEGGAVRMLNAPAGTTTTMGIVRGSSAAAGGGGETGGRELVGIESRVVGPDAFTLRLLTWT